MCVICCVLYVLVGMFGLLRLGSRFLSFLSSASWLVCYTHVFPCMYFQQDGRSAIMLAAAADQPHLVRALLKYKASTTGRDKVRSVVH